MTTYSYEIDPRPPELGGGCRLRLIENGEEVGGGVFPAANATEEAAKDAYADATAEGESWQLSRRAPSADEAAGMTWWNGLTEIERAKWLAIAGSAVVADAWAAFKRSPNESGFLA